ncbi:Hydroxyethylthiazole kinase family-domain-containing protein [Zychaea mexicana]|uniref:Hydroxyethylthiazole kinase family-domain-containing protein n=1 Tax=Zychaea mexicana TaxID=64656 RepID=UPI0022FDF3B3|nr:Hydroxyethylthiazole kinase family-domain-containing protein [Zychaea mexicana]KAI9497271.1 Hydroxyethylthiazole kinase family-domain-containing protein [Zychaea mexicana]
MAPIVDYSLYLVTDSSLVPKDATFLGQIEKALEGGVTLVQLREKDLDTGPFIDLAYKVKALTRRFNVPLIINDRIDVALAIDADGVHIGQDDMPMCRARQILGHSKIIGVSVNTIEEGLEAVRAGADYLGIGAVWDTSTKKLTKKTLGIQGVKDILAAIPPIPNVAIGGIKLNNGKELLANTTGVSGLSIVSAIMAAADPKNACEELLAMIREYVPGASLEQDVVKYAVKAAARVKSESPLVHHMTNNVVINDNANATLAVGASPIMSTNTEEVDDLAAINGAMVVNMGTLSPTMSDAMFAAMHSNAKNGNPVIFDPVGAAASKYRREMTQRFLDECKLAVLKGNTGEILYIANRGGQLRGVDSMGDNGGETNAATAVMETAKKYGCVVAMTGAIDYVSDGSRVFAIENGNPLMACITGSGCMVSSIVGCFTAVNRENYLFATIAALLTVTVASEKAGSRLDVNGPGTFRSALIDELYNITNDPIILTQYAKIREIKL